MMAENGGDMRAGRMIAAATLWLAACAPAPKVAAPAMADFSAEAIAGDPTSPPPGPASACWGRDTLPAVIETETVSRQVAPERRDAQGRVTQPATYASESRQRMVRDRATVWIRTPCRDAITPGTVAILQRALRARGYYLGPLDGELTAETLTAIRRYQADGGLDTPVLSLKAAQSLGLIATPL